MDGDLLLQPGSLVPAWYPWEVEGEELSAEERCDQFRFELDLFLRPTTAGAWNAHDVLRALLRLQ